MPVMTGGGCETENQISWSFVVVFCWQTPMSAKHSKQEKLESWLDFERDSKCQFFLATSGLVSDSPRTKMGDK